MKANLPLGKMSVTEKLQAMEAIWDDLCQDERRVTSPAWHGEVLAARAERVTGGKARFGAWEQAKRRIRRKVA